MLLCSAALNLQPMEDNQSQSPPISMSSLELLNKYRIRSCRFTTETLNKLMVNREQVDHPSQSQELSTEEIVRVAAACFVQAYDDNMSTTDDHLIDLFTLPSLINPASAESTYKLDIVILLLAAAKNLSTQQYIAASSLLDQCCRLCSSSGSPVERVVHYFSGALQQRINNETGSLMLATTIIPGAEAINAMRTNHPTQLVTQQKLPFSQLVHFISVQTIIDNLGSAKRVHVIDLSIKHGLQWTTLIQVLATRHTASPADVEYLKISAVGASEEAIASTGKMLARFAETTLSLPFDFNAVIVADMRDLREEMFGVKEGETVGIYSSMDMSTMIVRPDGLENLMMVLRKLKPCVMTVADVEANLNSSSFVVRFTEALVYYSAVFDYLNGFMEGDDTTRMATEGFLSQGISSIISAEGSERVVRHVGIRVWRSFFSRFGLMEAEMNEWSMYQASLLVEKFGGRRESCTVDKNGKSLTLGWKGTPLLFVSAWKYAYVDQQGAEVSTGI